LGTSEGEGKRAGWRDSKRPATTKIQGKGFGLQGVPRKVNEGEYFQHAKSTRGDIWEPHGRNKTTTRERGGEEKEKWRTRDCGGGHENINEKIKVKTAQTTGKVAKGGETQ